jgi:hypothetical protein
MGTRQEDHVAAAGGPGRGGLSRRVSLTDLLAQPHPDRDGGGA